VAVTGVATGFGQAVQLNPVAGAQENVPLPFPFIMTLSPEQTEISGPAFADGTGATDTVCTLLAEQPFAVAVTVYTEVDDGFKIMPAVVAPPGFHK